VPKAFFSSTSVQAAATKPRQLMGSPVIETTKISESARVTRWRSTSGELISLRHSVLSVPPKPAWPRKREASAALMVGAAGGAGATAGAAWRALAERLGDPGVRRVRAAP
jgi:hypothetical protein